MVNEEHCLACANVINDDTHMSQMAWPRNATPTSPTPVASFFIFPARVRETNERFPLAAVTVWPMSLSASVSHNSKREQPYEDPARSSSNEKGWLAYHNDTNKTNGFQALEPLYRHSHLSLLLPFETIQKLIPLLQPLFPS